MHIDDSYYSAKIESTHHKLVTGKKFICNHDSNQAAADMTKCKLFVVNKMCISLFMRMPCITHEKLKN